jgi:hypothetical protein
VALIELLPLSVRVWSYNVKQSWEARLSEHVRRKSRPTSSFSNWYCAKQKSEVLITCSLQVYSVHVTREYDDYFAKILKQTSLYGLVILVIIYLFLHGVRPVRTLQQKK